MSAIGLHAQESHFGARLGVNYTTMNVSDDNAVLDMNKYSDGKTGLSIGVVGDFMLSDQFALSGELNYATAGDFYTVSEEGTTIKLRQYFSYIQIPVMAKYFINENLYINAGPQLGILMSADSETEFNGEIDSKDVKDHVESTDLGLNVGAGYKFNNGLFLDLRYTPGLSDIDKDKDSSIKNNAIMFSVGYYFN